MRPETYEHLQQVARKLFEISKKSDREVPELTDAEKSALSALRDRLDVAAHDAVPVTKPFDPKAAAAAKALAAKAQSFIGMPNFASVSASIAGAAPVPAKPVEKWISAGGVVFPSMDDLEHVYIIKPANDYGPWSFPKGRIDEGETKEKAAIREVWEETGVRAKIMPGNAYIGKGTGSHSITHYFLMVQTGGSPRPTEETERVVLATWEEAAAKFKSVHNSRDYKILRMAQAMVQQRRG